MDPTSQAGQDARGPVGPLADRTSASSDQARPPRYMHTQQLPAQSVGGPRLILITADDPNDVSKWSGTLHSLYRALCAQTAHIRLSYTRGPLAFFDFAARVINRAVGRLGVPFDCRFSTAYAMLAGAYLTVRFLFVRNCSFVSIAGSNYVPYFATKRPIIYVSDGTFRCIARIYPAVRAFPTWLKVQGDNNERRTLSKARFVIYPSRWARDSAETDYRTPIDKIFELPFGPNIPEDVIERFYVPKELTKASILNLLFVSADWKRKNGDMVLDICRELKASGLMVRLIAVGSTPAAIMNCGFVEDRGFLDKSDPQQLAVLCEAYRDAHFLILPTVADAYGVVFSEAAAFGVPSVSYDVGGVGSAIVHGHTGLLLPLGASAAPFAKELVACFRDRERYQEMSRNCRTRYLTECSWGRWAELIAHLSPTA